MSDHEHQEADGPPPNPSDADPLEELEIAIEDLERPLGSDERTTAAEGLEGETLDERLSREVPDQGIGRRRPDLPTISAEDTPDDEPELVGDAVDAGSRPSPEEAAMRIRTDAPGLTDHEDDYAED